VPTGDVGSLTQIEVPTMFLDLPSVKATEIVRNRYEKSYGPPTPIGDTTVAFWNEWLRIDGTDDVIRPIDVTRDYGIMLALHKLARQCHSPLGDNIDDVCGYMNVHDMIAREA